MSERATKTDLILAHFKANQSLSNRDIRTIFNISVQESRDWASGRGVPLWAVESALFINNMIESIKCKTGQFNDQDYFLLLKRYEKSMAQVDELCSLVEKLRSQIPKTTSEEFKIETQNRDFDKAVKESLAIDRAHVDHYLPPFCGRSNV